jgi:arylsulfatase A-like enzyme
LTTEFDHISEAGITFEDVVSAAPWTIPAVKSHSTGMSPHKIGIFDDDAEARTTIFDRFKDEGYTTALYYDSDRRTELFPDSIDHYDWSYDLNALLDFISKNKDEPFFLFDLYRGTHLPYTLKYSSEAWHRAKDRLMDRIQNGGQEGIEEARYRYARSIERFSEWYLGAILDRLETEGILDETAIVVTSDHGESWGDRFDDQSSVDLFDLHGTLMFEEILRVPLVLFGFDLDGPNRVPHMVRSVDVLPTILGSLGFDYDPADFDGRSLELALAGEEGYPDHAYSCTTAYDLFAGIGSDQDGVMSTYSAFSVRRNDGWKYILSKNDGERELYNLNEDPNEQQNLIDENPDVCQELNERLREHFQSALDDEDDHTENLRKRLKDLGYL